MATWVSMRFILVVVAVAALTSLIAPGAQAQPPMCNAVASDPTLAACSCICEAGSSFHGCFNAATNTEVPTPNQCPDILQGRRVIAGGDALIVENPQPLFGGVQFDNRFMVFGVKNVGNNLGLGEVVGDPVVSYEAGSRGCSEVGTVLPFGQTTRSGRVFDLPEDVVVSVTPDDWSQCMFVVYEIFNADGEWLTMEKIFFDGTDRWLKAAMADFDQDGFDDLLMLSGKGALIFGAQDPGRVDRLVRGPAATTDSAGTMIPTNDPAIGDFNGDGLVDIAWIGGAMNPDGFGTGSLSVFFASVCPGDVPGSVLCDGAERFEIIVNPAGQLFPSVPGATSTIVLGDATLTEVDCTRQTRGRLGALAVGNFEDNGNGPGGAPIDELIVGYVVGSSYPSNRKGCWIRVEYFTFADPATTPDKSWALSQATNDRVLAEAHHTTTTQLLFAQAARLDWFGVTEQAVFSISNYYDSGAAKIGDNYPLTVTISGAGEQASMIPCLGQKYYLITPYFAFGSAVGNFSTSAEIDPPASCGAFGDDYAPGQCPFNPQIALFLSAATDITGSSLEPRIRLWNVRPSQPGSSTPALKCFNDESIESPYMSETYRNTVLGGNVEKMSVARARYGGSRLSVGDVLGNSTRVGEPTITRISNHTQPQFVIQAPPSLVDYVQPNEQDSTTPAIVNFTRAPGNFNAVVNFETTSEETASTREKTSYTSSASQTVGGKVMFKVPLVKQISIKNKTSWGQLQQENTSKQFGSYSASRLQTGGTIGVDDQLWWTETTFNVFNFPVLGQDVCPATLTCDASDPFNIDCNDITSPDSVELVCDATSESPGCHCLSEGASASLCPLTASCSENSGDICCSVAPDQLVLSVSGPQEVVRSSSPGANIEWYHPKHEPGQILSYPSSRALLQAREQNAEILGSLTNFTTGTNDASETLSWTCGTSGDFSVGTTTRHSFSTSTTITAGTNKIAKAAFGGGSVSFGFDYQNSDSISTLNSYSVGQTASSNITVNLQGAGFLNTPQYAYGVQGAVLGGVQPEDVLDTPELRVCPSDNTNCTAAQEVPTDCTTTGPVNVAFAANPTSTGNGVWWQAGSPYSRHIDVALNNASRWRRVTASQVADPTLQCRGPANTPVCYTTNQPPTGTSASDVWGSLFYSMKGLMLTTGGAAGPQRDTVSVGDEVFTQLRVNNYSLRTMAPGTRVLARIYRQQLDVHNNNGPITGLYYATDNNGDPIPAVPVGPTGLGDPDPIPVVSPLDGSATIPPFNTTSDPARDNIAVATTSYVPGEEDACEYEEGVLRCDGAYYAYWVTVWAEDADGNVLPELPGHGIGADFDPDTIYPFITDVPLETVTFDGESTTFSNNVSFYKKVFAIIPEDAAQALPVSAPNELTLARLTVTPKRVNLGEPVVVSAELVSFGASPEATVVFSDGDRQNGSKVFDAEFLPYIRPNDAYISQVTYTPETCGTHELSVELADLPLASGDEVTAVVDVGIDFDSAIRFLIDEVRDLQLAVSKKADRRKKFRLVLKLRVARWALDAGRTRKGIYLLEQFNHDIERYEHRGRITPEKADMLIAQSDQIAGCVEGDNHGRRWKYSGRW